jgi:hypothetical protein
VPDAGTSGRRDNAARRLHLEVEATEEGGRRQLERDAGTLRVAK